MNPLNFRPFMPGKHWKQLNTKPTRSTTYLTLDPKGAVLSKCNGGLFHLVNSGTIYLALPSQKTKRARSQINPLQKNST